jgi:hypothetical protein
MRIAENEEGFLHFGRWYCTSLPDLDTNYDETNERKVQHQQ